MLERATWNPRGHCPNSRHLRLWSTIYTVAWSRPSYVAVPCASTFASTLNRELSISPWLLPFYSTICVDVTPGVTRQDIQTMADQLLVISLSRSSARSTGMSPSSTLCAGDTSRTIDHRENNPISTSASAARTLSTSSRPRERLRQSVIE
jgi:hypothetical protein